MDSFDPESKQSFKEFITPDGEKYGKPLGQKIKAFRDSHPTVDVSPQALITLSTEEQGKLKTDSQLNWLCIGGTPLVLMATNLYCNLIYSWNADVMAVMACGISMTTPWFAVCFS